MNERRIYEDAINTWGAEAQTMMLFEEMGELMQAIGKLKRAKDGEQYIERLENIAEEIADVSIMLEQMKILFGVEDAVDDRKRHKLARLEGRIIMAREREGAR